MRKHVSDRCIRALKLYESGMSVKDIAFEIGVSYTMVRTWIRIEEINQRHIKEESTNLDSIYHLDISSSVYGYLKRGGIDTISQLRRCMESGNLLSIWGIGKKSIEEIKEAIKLHDERNEKSR